MEGRGPLGVQIRDTRYRRRSTDRRPGHKTAGVRYSLFYGSQCGSRQSSQTSLLGHQVLRPSVCVEGPERTSNTTTAVICDERADWFASSVGLSALTRTHRSFILPHLQDCPLDRGGPNPCLNTCEINRCLEPHAVFHLGHDRACRTLH